MLLMLYLIAITAEAMTGALSAGRRGMDIIALLFMGVITQTITKEKSEHLDLGTVIRSDAMLDKLKPFVEGLL